MVLLATELAPAEYAETYINPTLKQALVALCRARPEDPVTFLAQHLHDHKPPPPVRLAAAPRPQVLGGAKAFDANPALNQAQQESLHRLTDQFKKFDKDGSGDLDVRELESLLRTAGLTLTPTDVARLLAQYDEDSSGTLSMDEFIVLARRELALAGELEIYAAAFQAADADNSGEIDVSELGALMAQLGHPSDPADLAKVCATFDVDDSGKLSFDEFIQIAKAGLVDVAEVRAALQDAAALADGEQVYTLPVSSATDAFNPPGHVVEAMCALITKHAADLDGLAGNDALETDTIHAVLVKLVRDLVHWEDGLERFPAESRGVRPCPHLARSRCPPCHPRPDLTARAAPCCTLQAVSCSRRRPTIEGGGGRTRRGRRRIRSRGWPRGTRGSRRSSARRPRRS